MLASCRYKVASLGHERAGLSPDNASDCTRVCDIHKRELLEAAADVS